MAHRMLVASALVFAGLLHGSAQLRAQAVDITIGDNVVTFAAEASARSVSVEIFSPDGEQVFAGRSGRGGVINWKKLDKRAQPVADGVYIAAVTVTTTTGNVKKRVEQIVVDSQSESAAQTVVQQAVAAITGAGSGNANSGRIPRFTGANTIGNSIMRQATGAKIGINIDPAAVLHVNKAPPAAGTNATTLLQTSGGKGGRTNVSGTVAGRGAGISLVAGNGGNAVSGATNGSGGNITLQPGSPGTGGTGGGAGNVLLAPFAGNVGIGTANPSRALQIGPSFDAMFTIEPSDGSPRAGFIRFGDHTGWKLHFGRSREFSGGPLNTGLTGNLLEIQDNGKFRLVGFPEGPTGLGPLCQTLANVVTICSSGAASLPYRKNAEPYRGGLDIIGRLQPIAFMRTDTGLPAIGLAAEEVEAAEPRLAYRNEKGEVEGVNYDLMGVLFVNAIKQQQQQLERQQDLIDRLQSRLESLEVSNEQRLSAK